MRNFKKNILILLAFSLIVFEAKDQETRFNGKEGVDGADERIIEVYENQIWIWNQGWVPSSHSSRLPHWSYSDGSKALSVMEIRLPDDWEWTSAWQTDEDKWEYGVPSDTSSGTPVPWLGARLRRRRWWRAMAPSGALQQMSDLPFERSRAQNATIVKKPVSRPEVYLSSDYQPEVLTQQPRRLSIVRAVGWNFKGIGFGFKKPLLTKGVVFGLRVPLSRNFDTWDRCQFLPSISTFWGGSVNPLILTAAVSCSYPLEFFTSAITFNRALMRERRDTVRRLGGTFTVVYTPERGLRHTFAPWFFLLPGARAVFQFCRAVLLWLVTAYDQIMYQSIKSPKDISLKGRFPTLWRLRRWTGSKTSGLGYSVAYKPTQGIFSSSVLLNFEPFFHKKKRKREEELAILEHEIKQQKHRKESKIKHRTAWYEQGPEAVSWANQIEKQMEKDDKERLMAQLEEFNEDLKSVGTTVLAKNYYMRQNWYLPKDKEVSYVDTWFDPNRNRSRTLQYWYNPQEKFVTNAATNSSNFVEQAANQCSDYIADTEEALRDDEPKHLQDNFAVH